MPYVPKFRHLVKILLRMRDVEAAEALWLEGTWLHEMGDDGGALMAFQHSRLLDREFGGAYYNFAALTEKSTGNSPRTIQAWQDYLRVAEKDSRQARETVEKVRHHLEELRNNHKGE